jgi:hypothetical protein
MSQQPDHNALAREAKALVALAFRNGPLERVHAGKTCAMCAGKPEFSHITNAEMKEIMKAAVDRVFSLLRLKVENPNEYERQIQFGDEYTVRWDPPRGADDHA